MFEASRRGRGAPGKGCRESGCPWSRGYLFPLSRARSPPAKGRFAGESSWRALRGWVRPRCGCTVSAAPRCRRLCPSSPFGFSPLVARDTTSVEKYGQRPPHPSSRPCSPSAHNEFVGAGLRELSRGGPGDAGEACGTSVARSWRAGSRPAPNRYRGVRACAPSEAGCAARRRRDRPDQATVGRGVGRRGVPRIEFRIGDGALVEFEDGLRRRGRVRSLFHKRVGDVVDVLYDPGNPRDATTISSPTPRIGPALYLTLEGALLCIGLRIVLEYL